MNKDQLLSQLYALIEQVAALPDHEPVSTGIALETVTEAKASELSGYTIATLEGRRRAGKLKKYEHWWHDTEGKVIYDIKKLQELMQCPHQQKESTQASRSEAKQSASVSPGKKKDSGKSTPHLLHLPG